MSGLVCDSPRHPVPGYLVKPAVRCWRLKQSGALIIQCLLFPMAKTVHAACSHDCPDSCGVLITVDDLGRATKLRGDPNHPVTRGFVCAKVAKYLDRVYSPDRVLYPMRRIAAKGRGVRTPQDVLQIFDRISWEQAYDEIAQRFEQISREFGPEAILPYSYAGTTAVLS